MPSRFSLELEKVAEIRAIIGSDDPDLIHDTLEGQTDVYELIDWMLARIGDEESMEEAIENRISALMERKKACEGRIIRLRGAIEACLTATGEKSLRRPEATLTLANRKVSISHIDETILPEKFFKTTRSVSRTTISEALKSGEIVPGVTLDNGGVTLTIRRK
jgi:Siphovirus Gp157